MLVWSRYQVFKHATKNWEVARALADWQQMNDLLLPSECTNDGLRLGKDECVSPQWCGAFRVQLITIDALAVPIAALTLAFV